MDRVPHQPANWQGHRRPISQSPDLSGGAVVRDPKKQERHTARDRKNQGLLQSGALSLWCSRTWSPFSAAVHACTTPARVRFSPSDGQGEPTPPRRQHPRNNQLNAQEFLLVSCPRAPSESPPSSRATRSRRQRHQPTNPPTRTTERTLRADRSAFVRGHSHRPAEPTRRH